MYEHFWFERYKPKPGDVIVDIGAGKGEDIAAFSAAVKPGGRVLAVEAHPDYCRELHAVCDTFTVAESLHAACAGKTGVFQVHNCKNWESSYVTEPKGVDGLVRGYTLTDILVMFGITRVDLLKMNIEGSELEALQGGVASLPIVRHAVIGCHDFRANRGEGERFRTGAAVTRLLRDNGFETWMKPGWYHVHAWRPGT